MTIPMKMLWQVQMSIRKKLALSGIFCLVTITMLISIIRTSINSTSNGRTDPSWLNLWSSIEQCIGQFMVSPHIWEHRMDIEH